MNASTPLLDQIKDPVDLRLLRIDQLNQLASELRQDLIHQVSQTGGHLASGLGAIELTIALHYVYNTPHDRLVWDVGHQTYPHKILTGRREKMSTLRQYGGLSGFPKLEESEYDHFGVGHSSTSISAALGMAIAAKAQGIQRECIAVIGDGGMTAGMAFEALNHAGALNQNLLVVLNDNEMSISPNVGALSQYLSRIWAGRLYSSVRENSKRVLKGLPLPGAVEFARRAEEHVKGMITPGTLFEELGFHYYGPIDGHNLPELVQTLSNIKNFEGPRLLHIVTRKGRGYAPAEDDACRYHGVTPFDRQTGTHKPSSPPKKSFTQVFSQWIDTQAAQDNRLHVITPAMREGSGLVEFHQKYPQRYHDVGIAEQHALTLAAAMALDGLKPVVAIYSTFLQRAYDQYVHDIALQNLDVLFAVDRAGIVGADGATHTGNFDLAYLRGIPNTVLMTPMNGLECQQLLSLGYQHPGPAFVRYPRDHIEESELLPNLDTPFKIGQAEIIREGSEVAVLMFGPLLDRLQATADLFDLTLVNMRFVKPLDLDCLQQLSHEHPYWISIEDHAVQGGAGSAVLEAISQQGWEVQCQCLGLKDAFPAQGSRQQILDDMGLSADAIEQIVRQLKP